MNGVVSIRIFVPVALLFVTVALGCRLLAAALLPSRLTDGLLYVPTLLAVVDAAIFALLFGGGNFMRRFFLFKVLKVAASIVFMLAVLLLGGNSPKAVAVVFLCSYLALLLPETAAALFIGKHKKTVG